MRYIKKKSDRVFPLARLASLALTLVLLSSFSTSVFAQNGGGVTGHVTDERGANVAGAEVRLRSRVGARLFARTDESGVYTFNGLAPGNYILEATARGFAALTSDEFRVERGQKAVRDMTLPVAAVNEMVVVIATGTPQRADEVSKSVTLLEEDQIEAKRELSLHEALRGTPGLRVQQQGRRARSPTCACAVYEISTPRYFWMGCGNGFRAPALFQRFGEG